MLMKSGDWQSYTTVGIEGWEFQVWQTTLITVVNGLVSLKTKLAGKQLTSTEKNMFIYLLFTLENACISFGFDEN